ncbi:MAG: PQQ-dependent sugar dehydrogenase [Pseudomonadota bacterium]
MRISKKLWWIGLPLATIAVGLAFGLKSFANPGPKMPNLTAAQAGVKVVTLARGLENPWGLAFLPNGQLLVTEKPGRLRFVDSAGTLSEPITGLPAISTDAQGGLLGLALDPNFASNQRIYMSFSEPDPDMPERNGTAVLRARLSGAALTEVTVIWRQAPKMESDYHFGSRLVFDREGYLYVTTGERYIGMKDAQKTNNAIGKVVRITTDGAPAPGNPFLQDAAGFDEVFSYGHRNLQGAALHPETGVLWTHEHGPRGGDELNIIRPGRNYGWPEITYGIDYDMSTITEYTAKPGMEQPIHYWVPSIAPSGMTFYTADKYPGWKGNILIGSLAHSRLVRLVIEGEKVMQEIQMLGELEERLRDVVQGPDGYIYLLTDNEDGRILRLDPAA